MRVLVLCDDYWHPGRVPKGGLGLLAGPDWQFDYVEDVSGWSPERLKDYPVVVLSKSNDVSVQAAAQAVGQAADHVDLLINNAGIFTASDMRGPRDGLDYDAMHRMYDINALGPLRVVEAFLPLMERGEMKRLCFVSSEAGSINRCRRKGQYGYCMSKTALNIGVSILFNRLRPQGYTFRVYHPGWMRSYMSGVKGTQADLEPEEAAIPAAAYFLRDRGGSAQTAARNDENRLLLRDYLSCEWPW